jgi:hypothetical protein
MKQDELTGLLIAVIEELTGHRYFEEWSMLEDVDTELKHVERRLRRALAIAESLSQPAEGQNAPTSHRWQ